MCGCSFISENTALAVLIRRVIRFVLQLACGPPLDLDETFLHMESPPLTLTRPSYTWKNHENLTIFGRGQILMTDPEGAPGFRPVKH